MRALGWLMVATVLATASRARADEKEFQLSAAPLFSLVHTGDDRTAWGGGGAVDLAYGVTDAVSLRLTGALSAHHVAALTNSNDQVVAPEGTVLAWFVGAGLTYTIDIVRVVPSIDFAIGWLDCSRPDDKSCLHPNQPGSSDTGFDHIGVQIGIAVDYLVNRRVSVGILARYQGSLTALTSLPLYFYAGPRVLLHFGG